MPGLEVKDLKRALVAAGLEVFRVRDDEVHLAERQNVQLMEAGVRVRAGEQPRVTVVARAQRDDSPTVTEAAFLEAVRQHVAPLLAVGFREVHAGARELRNVSDSSHVLDVWYEVTLERDVTTIAEAVAEAQRAVGIERYIVVPPR